MPAPLIRRGYIYLDALAAGMFVAELLVAIFWAVPTIVDAIPVLWRELLRMLGRGG